MKRFSKIIVALSCMALLASAFAGCGGNTTEHAQTDGKNFTYWAVMDPMSQETLQNYNEMMFYQEMEKRTGVHIDFIHPIEGSTGNEAFIAMLSGDKIPDMIEYNWGSYSGGPQQALDDDVIIALNDYMKDHAPNYYDYMEGEKGKADNYEYKLQATTDDGRYYGFNILNIGETKGFAGLYTRADLLKKWDMEIPETIDEWEAVFAKAKAEGFSKPFTSACDVISFKSATTHSFNTAFNVGKQMYLEDGKVVFAPFEKGYKEYVAQMADWFKKGYIDAGFITNDSAKIESNMTNGTSMTTYGYVGSGIGKILPAAQAQNPEFDLVACPNPVANSGEVAQFQNTCSDASTEAIGISTTCGNFEKAIELLLYNREFIFLKDICYMHPEQFLSTCRIRLLLLLQLQRRMC
ncbi:MAG: extracellular solute-binding protein [Ruminococcaceae bacterium]|nr:extracellular solute-binding protein [Oscillospiraceae bacterium]